MKTSGTDDGKVQFSWPNLPLKWRREEDWLKQSRSEQALDYRLEEDAEESNRKL